jgi:hypothetical protein
MVGGSLDLGQGRFLALNHSASAMGRQFKEAWLAGQREAASDLSLNFGVRAEDSPGKVRNRNRLEDDENRGYVRRWYRMEVKRTRARLLNEKAVWLVWMDPVYQACPNAGTGTMFSTPPQPETGAPSISGTLVCMYFGNVIPKLAAALRRGATLRGGWYAPARPLTDATEVLSEVRERTGFSTTWQSGKSWEAWDVRRTWTSNCSAPRSTWMQFELVIG